MDEVHFGGGFLDIFLFVAVEKDDVWEVPFPGLCFLTQTVSLIRM